MAQPPQRVVHIRAPLVQHHTPDAVRRTLTGRAPAMSTTTTETLEVTVERGPKGGFGIAIVPGSNGDAYVDYVQDKAKESGLIQAGDHITHVGGDGPLQCRAACAKLREATKEAELAMIPIVNQSTSQLSKPTAYPRGTLPQF